MKLVHIALWTRDLEAAAGFWRDHFEARIGDRTRIVEVRQIIVKRVGAARAVECYVDFSPPPPERPPHAAFAERDPGAGRPTKRDRRRTDRLRGR